MAVILCLAMGMPCLPATLLRAGTLADVAHRFDDPGNEPVPASAPLAGQYTINRALPTQGSNFANFTDFAQAINTYGLAAAVIVDVVAGSGPYNEQLKLGSLAGSTAVRSLTINGHGQMIEYLSYNSNDRSVVSLSGTSHVRVNNLIIAPRGQDAPWDMPREYGWGIHLKNGCSHITFDNCQVEVNTSSTSLNFAGIVASNADNIIEANGLAVEHLTIQNCTITGGRYGVAINGPISDPYPPNNRVINSVIADFHDRGIYLANQLEARIDGNTLSRPTRNRQASVSMIFLKNNLHGSAIINNLMTGFSAVPITDNTYGINSSNIMTQAGTPLLIYNNHISGFRHINGFQYGIMLSTVFSTYVKLYHNTVFLDNEQYSGNGFVCCLYHMGDNANLDIRNNIFSYTTTSSGQKVNMCFTRTTSTIVSNNNVLHRGAEGMPERNTCLWTPTNAYETLADWQGFMGSQYDQQSSDADPLFVSPVEGNLLPTSTQINNMGANLQAHVATDRLGESRPMAPDPGAYEFDPASCQRPSAPAVSQVTMHSVKLNWTVNGVEESWNIEWGPAGFVPGEGNLLEAVTQHPYTLDGLAHSSPYDFYVQAVCPDKAVSYWTGPARFFTACGPITLPAREQFDEAIPPDLPYCWNKVVESTSNFADITVVSNNAYSDPNCVYFDNNTDASPTLILVSPQIAVPLSGIRVGFMARVSSQGSLDVGTMSGGGQFTLHQNVPLTNGYVYYNISFSDYTGADNYVAFRHGGGLGGSWIRVDDIAFSGPGYDAAVGGQIDDLYGNPVSGAHVYTGRHETISGDDSNYLLDGLYPQTYEVIAEAGGYAFESETLVLESGQQAVQHFTFGYMNPDLPYKPQLVSQTPLPEEEDGWAMRGAASDGRHIFLAANNDRLYTYDYNAPASPLRLGSISLETIGRVFFHHHLFVGTGNNISLLDVSNPTSPLLLATVDVGGKLMDMCFEEGVAYALVWVADNASKLVTLNMADPAAPVMLASLDVTGGDAGHLYYDAVQKLIYIHGLSQNVLLDMQIADVADAKAPSLVYSRPNDQTNSRMTGVDGHYIMAYNIDGQGYIAAYATENPDTPVLVNEMQLFDRGQVLELSNIDGTLLLHIRVPKDGMRMVAMVWDNQEKAFFRGVSLLEGAGVMATRFAYVKGGFGEAASGKARIDNLAGLSANEHQMLPDAVVDDLFLASDAVLEKSYIITETGAIRYDLIPVGPARVPPPYMMSSGYDYRVMGWEKPGLITETFPPPVGLSVPYMGPYTATLQWQPGGEEQSWQVELGEIAFLPGASEALQTLTVSENTVTVDQLTPNTSYDWYVRGTQDNERYSSWSERGEFTTPIQYHHLTMSIVPPEARLEGCTTEPPPGTTSYESITTQEISALPSAPWAFKQWHGAGAGNPSGILVEGHVEVIAEFVKAELIVGGITPKKTFCAHVAMESTEADDFSSFVSFHAVVDDWELMGFTMQAQGSGHDSHDIKQLTVHLNPPVTVSYPEDNGAVYIPVNPPVVIPEGQTISLLITYTFDVDIDRFATDELKGFGWTIPASQVSAIPKNYPPGIKDGEATLEGICFGRVYNEPQFQFFPSLQSAVDATPANGTITLCPIWHQDNVILDKPLTIRGEADRADDTVLSPLDKRRPVFTIKQGAGDSIFEHFIVTQEK